MSYDPIHPNVFCMGKRLLGGSTTVDRLKIRELSAGTHIYQIDNAVPARLCRKVMRFFNKKKELHYDGETISGANPNKKCRELRLDGQLINDSLEAGVLDRDLAEKFKRGFNAISKLCPGFFTGSCTDSKYQIQHYLPDDGWFNWHIDTLAPRTLAAILYLNDVTFGGETEFWYQNIKVKPKPGRLLIFPAGQGYAHRGVPAKSDKFIITTFLEVR